MSIAAVHVPPLPYATYTSSVVGSTITETSADSD
jgi:hypothetical protein